MEQKLKSEGYDAAFKKGHDSDPLEPTVIVPVVTTSGQHERPWIKLDTKYNKLVLLGAIVLAMVLLFVLLMEGPHKRSVEDEWSALQSAAFGAGHRAYSPAESKIEALVQETTPYVSTTTTTTTTTTEAPREELAYITASIIVNNATVPRMDTTFSGIFNQISRADAFVVLYVIGNKSHRKVGQTPVDKNTLSPKWNYLFEHEMKLMPDSILDFEIWDWDAVGKDERIGKLYVKMSQLIGNEELNGKMIRKEYGNGYHLWFTVHWRPHYRVVSV